MNWQSTLEIPDISSAISDLGGKGWAALHTIGNTEEEISSALKEVGVILGQPAQGRAKSVQETLRPVDRFNAHPRSLSALYGTDQFPFHVELGHRRRPCRYILLGCIEPGAPSSATLLMDWTQLVFDEQEYALLEHAPVLVRTGRRSFYSTILPKGREFLRFDPGCMEAVDRRGRQAIELVRNRLASADVQIQDWRKGDMLLIDNWRLLHGREPSSAKSGRILARVLIDG